MVAEVEPKGRMLVVRLIPGGNNGVKTWILSEIVFSFLL